MADIVTRQRVDDLDPSITEGVERYRFSWGGHDLEIDLGPKSAKKLQDAMDLYVPKARRVEVDTTPDPVPKSVRRRQAVSPSGGESKEQLQAMRVWARDAGLEVSDRGRISAKIREAFAAAHQ
jgi:hypothetical protein